MEEIESLVIPISLQRLLGLSFRLPPPQPEQVEALELSRWSRLKLDFVLAGVSSCGTNSLYENLRQHPELVFTHDTKTDQFFYEDTNILPYKHRLDDFNTAVEARLAKVRKNAQGKIVFGLRHPGLFGSPRIRQALSRIPSLRVVAVVCDPLSRFEKSFFLFHFCPAGSFPFPVDPKSVSHRCWPNLTTAIDEDGPWLLHHWRVGEHLRSLGYLLGLNSAESRLHLVHQMYMRTNARETFDGIASFIGASSPFPFSAQFQRHNSVRGHRTELCRSPSLQKVLQESLAPEYVALEELLTLQQRSQLQTHGEPILPPELLLRQSRCDRPEELSTIYQAGVIPGEIPAGVTSPGVLYS